MGSCLDYKVELTKGHITRKCNSYEYYLVNCKHVEN